MSARTQDLIFTLYGDYLIYRGGTAWIGSLIELLGALDVSEPAARATASRMARKGWLQTERQGRNSYYSLTAKATALLSEGAQQIFQRPLTNWDGAWYLVTYTFSDDLKQTRHQLRKQLSWLGFGQLGNGTLISPRDRQVEVQAILDELNAHANVNYFRAETIQLNGRDSLAARCWDLTPIRQRYHAFSQQYQPLYDEDLQRVDEGAALPPAYAFRRRFWLMHEYRYFPFHDPNLPAALLPEDWPGDTAVTLFQNYHVLLETQANAYVDDVLAKSPKNRDSTIVKKIYQHDSN